MCAVPLETVTLCNMSKWHFIKQPCIELIRMYLGLGMPSHTPFSCQGHQGHALQGALQRRPCASCWASSAAAAGRVGGREVWAGLGDPPWGAEGEADPLCRCLVACLHFKNLLPFNYVSISLKHREWQNLAQGMAEPGSNGKMASVQTGWQKSWSWLALIWLSSSYCRLIH